MRRPTQEQLNHLIGIPAVATRLAVKQATVNSWIARGQLVDPITRVDGKPLYWWPDIIRWADARKT